MPKWLAWCIALTPVVIVCVGFSLATEWWVGIAFFGAVAVGHVFVAVWWVAMEDLRK